MNDGEDRDAGAAEIGGTGAAGITGGTDKAGAGGLADSEAHRHDETGVREEGDVSGATSTHAGAGGAFDNTGGTGTAPTSD